MRFQEYFHHVITSRYFDSRADTGGGNWETSRRDPRKLECIVGANYDLLLEAVWILLALFDRFQSKLQPSVRATLFPIVES